jgi:hypothetical protein
MKCSMYLRYYFKSRCKTLYLLIPYLGEIFGFSHHHHHHHHRLQWLYSSSGRWPPLIRFRNQILRYTVGLSGRMFSSLQGLYLHRSTQYRMTKDKHPCPKRDSNPRSSKAHASDRGATGSA